jgi:hypothetical protein
MLTNFSYTLFKTHDVVLFIVGFHMMFENMDATQPYYPHFVQSYYPHQT